MSQLICEKLCLGYGGKTIVENLCFSVNKGDYIYIMGENGSGKTTLIKSILKLIAPIEGKLEISSKRVGYLPQQVNILNDFPASVKEIILSGTINGGFRPFYTKKEKKIAETNMKKLKIEKLTNCSFSSLSGGQKQKVLLARALCAAEDMLVLDEPTNGLDPEAAKEMYNIIKELNKSGITVLLVSHDVSSAVKYATHILEIGNNPGFYTRSQFVGKMEG